MLKKITSGAVIIGAFFFYTSAFSQSGDANYGDLDQEIENSTESLANLGGMDKNGIQGKIEESYITKFMDSASKKFLSEFLDENPFSKVPESQLRTILQSRFEGTPIGSYLKGDPKRMDFFVELVRDKQALPSFIKIVNRPDKVKKYGIIVICVFVASFIFNLFNKKGNLFQRLFRKLVVSLAAVTVNIGAFYFIFQDEIQPGLNIFFKYFHL